MSKWKKCNDDSHSRAFGDVCVSVYRLVGAGEWCFDIDYQHNGDAPTKKAAKAAAKRMGQAIARALEALDDAELNGDNE